MKRLIFFIALGLSPAAGFASQPDCQTIHGSFRLWNGWPPALRLVDKATGKVYGILASTKLPKPMAMAITTHNAVHGSFCVMQTGQVTHVPDDPRAIVLVRVIRYQPD